MNLFEAQKKTRGPAMADDNFCMRVPPQLEKLILAEQSHKSLRIFTLSFFRVLIQIIKPCFSLPVLPFTSVI